jgi:hypothetical protein
MENLKPKSPVCGPSSAEDTCTRVMMARQFAPALLVAVLGSEFGFLFFEASRNFFGMTSSLHFMFQVSSLFCFLECTQGRGRRDASLLLFARSHREDHPC